MRTVTVTPIGVQRRVLSLMWIGHSEQAIADMARVPLKSVRKARAGEYVPEEDRLLLACAWSRNQCRLAPVTRGSQVAHKTAVDAGAHSPLAWNEDEIDLYHAEPHDLTRGRDRSPWNSTKKGTEG